MRPRDEPHESSLRQALGRPLVLARCGAALALLLVAGCRADSDVAAQPAASASAGPFTLPAAQRERIQVAPVALSAFHRTLETTGTVAFIQNRSTHVVSPVSGTVVEIMAALGASVKAGDPLAKVASPDFAAAVSAYKKASIVGQNLRRIAGVDKDLVASGNIGRRELDQAEVDAASADADRDAALEQLRALGTPTTAKSVWGDGSSAVLRAPMDGTVVELGITPGQLLEQGGTDCFTVAELSSMWVMASVFETDLPFVHVGDAADVIVGPLQHVVPGKVEYVSDVVDPATRAIAVRIVAENPDRVLKKDAYVNVALHSTHDDQGLLIPVAALLLDAESLSFVFIANEDGSFSRRRVTTGVRSGEQIEITDGLHPGDRIVTQGGLFVQFAESQ